MKRVKVPGHTRKDGSKVRSHTRTLSKGKSNKSGKKYRTLKHGVRTSSKDPRKPGLWPNYWMKKRRQGK